MLKKDVDRYGSEMLKEVLKWSDNKLKQEYKSMTDVLYTEEHNEYWHCLYDRVFVEMKERKLM